ncbi:hypothetical protein SERLA73DRAFT_17349, partial [Serpula lacrymans var. lacrymans S7.3]
YGFFEVKVTTPDNLKHPILQLKYDTGNGLRTIAPVGKWKNMFYSEEIYNAMEYGYKF